MTLSLLLVHFNHPNVVLTIFCFEYRKIGFIIPSLNTIIIRIFPGLYSMCSLLEMNRDEEWTCFNYVLCCL